MSEKRKKPVKYMIIIMKMESGISLLHGIGLDKLT